MRDRRGGGLEGEKGLLVADAGGGGSESSVMVWGLVMLLTEWTEVQGIGIWGWRIGLGGGRGTMTCRSTARGRGF